VTVQAGTLRFRMSLAEKAICACPYLRPHSSAAHLKTLGNLGRPIGTGARQRAAVSVAMFVAYAGERATGKVALRSGADASAQWKSRRYASMLAACTLTLDPREG